MLKTHPNVFFLPVFCAIVYFLAKKTMCFLLSIEHTTHVWLLYSCQCRTCWSFTSVTAHPWFILCSPAPSCPQAFQLNSRQGTSSQYFIFSPRCHQDESYHREDNISQACGTHSPVASTGLVCPTPNKPPLQNHGH